MAKNIFSDFDKASIKEIVQNFISELGSYGFHPIVMHGEEHDDIIIAPKTFYVQDDADIDENAKEDDYIISDDCISLSNALLAEDAQSYDPTEQSLAKV